MDFEILPQLIIVISALGILFIIGRNYSKVKEASRAEVLFMETAASAQDQKEKFDYLLKRATRRINKENYQKAVARFWVMLEKTLRKIRISMLKLDSRIVGWLEHLRKKNTERLNMLKDTERAIRKNMENENFSKFFNAKRHEIHTVTPSEPDEDPIRRDGADGRREEVSITEEIIVVEEAIGQTEAEQEASEMMQEIEDAELAEAEAPEEKPPVRVVERYSNEEETPAEETGESPTEAAQEEKPDAEQTPEGIGSEEESSVRTKKEDEYIQMLMEDPHDVKAYWKLGLIYSKRRNYDDALACFRQITKIDPTYTKAKQKALELMEKMKKKGK